MNIFTSIDELRDIANCVLEREISLKLPPPIEDMPDDDLLFETCQKLLNGGTLTPEELAELLYFLADSLEQKA